MRIFKKSLFSLALLFLAAVMGFSATYDQAVASIRAQVQEQMKNKAYYKLVIFEFQEASGRVSPFSRELMADLTRELAATKKFVDITPIPMEGQKYMPTLSDKQKRTLASQKYEAYCIGKISVKGGRVEVKITIGSLSSSKNPSDRWSYNVAVSIDKDAEVSALIDEKPAPAAPAAEVEAAAPQARQSADTPKELSAFVGRWEGKAQTEDGWLWTVTLELTADEFGDMRGEVLWILKDTPREDHEKNVGKRGREYLKLKKIDARDSRIRLTTYKQDGVSEISLYPDEALYDLVLTSDGLKLTGKRQTTAWGQPEMVLKKVK